MNAPAAVTPRSNLKDHFESALNSGADAGELMSVISTACAASHNAAWEALALVDQYYRRRRLTPDDYRALKAHVEQLALGRPSGGDRPATAASRPAPPSAGSEGNRPANAAAAGDGRLAQDLRETTGQHSAMQPLGPPKVGMLLRGRYRLEARLDYGNGVVFQALDEYRKALPAEEQRVAIRFPGDAADAQREFFRAQHLSHPNIARVIEFDRDGDTAFYIMELQHGRLLRDVLQKATHLPLPQSEALAIVRDIAAALEHAHSRGVQHGCLDARSVLIAQDGSVRVLNFGLPRAEDDTVEPADDLRSLCLIAYELLAGRPAFEGLPLDEAHERGLRLTRPPGLHQRQWHALQRGLADSSEGHSVELMQWLEEMEVGRAATHAAAPVELMHRTPAPAWRRPVVLGGAALAFAAVLATAIMTWQSQRNDASRIAAGAPVAGSQAEPASEAASKPDTPVSALTPASTPARPATVATVASAATVTGATAAATAATAADGRDAGAVLLAFATDSFTVAPGESAARIPVRRSGSTRDDVGFVWWTEGGTARPGDDFVSFGEQRELIAGGQKSVSLYVPLAGGSRATESEFYVNISEPSGGARLGRITRLRVIIAAD